MKSALCTAAAAPEPVEVGLGLGANLGDRRSVLSGARARLAALPGVRSVESSPLYETEPVGARPEFRSLWYLNAVVLLAFAGELGALAEAIHAIEADFGRVRVEDRNAPRTLDIDLLYAGDRVVRTAALVLPHPRWAERRFVVQPLADLRPALRLPGAPGSVADVLAGLLPTPVVRRVDGAW